MSFSLSSGQSCPTCARVLYFLLDRVQPAGHYAAPKHLISLRSQRVTAHCQFVDHIWSVCSHATKLGRHSLCSVCYHHHLFVGMHCSMKKYVTILHLAFKIATTKPDVCRTTTVKHTLIWWHPAFAVSISNRKQILPLLHPCDKVQKCQCHRDAADNQK